MVVDIRLYILLFVVLATLPLIVLAQTERWWRPWFIRHRPDSFLFDR